MERKFDPGTAVIAPTSTVEISISCRSLLDKDILSKSDPMCVIYHRPPGANHWVELVRTETIKDNLNPDFEKKLTLEYRFEEQQPLRFEIYDIDSMSVNLEDHDFLGFAETNVALIVSSGTEGLAIPLSQNVYVSSSPSEKPKNYGTIILLAEELSSLKDEVTFKFGGSEIGSLFCCFVPPSVYYVISKVNEASKYVVVLRSERAVGPDPNWQPVTVTARSLCNGDRDRGLKIELFSVKMSGVHSLLGSCLTNLNQLVSLGNGGGLKLLRPDGRESRSTFLVLNCKIAPIYTFVDYIQNGTKIHCCFAIDFTSSNGDPSDTTSLHHFSESSNRPNPYEQAIHSVGQIIQDYDSTKTFPVYGFGARIPPHGAVSHNFYVSLQDTPFCFGLQGVLESYRNCIRLIQMYGPTNFSPIINHVANMAAQYQNGEHYYVLLIITDGIITDMQNTKEAIVNASVLPLSIIIIGVGGADFEAMEELDGDAVRISHNGRFAVRDIVQFVPYRDAQSWMSSTVGPGMGPNNQYQSMPVPYGHPSWNQPTEATHRMAQVKLAQEVLAEIPDQLTSYMKSQSISPKMRASSAASARNPTP